MTLSVPDNTRTRDAHYRDFLVALAEAGFSGEISGEQSTRAVLATDNSIYQVMPQAVISPRTTDDLIIAMRLADQPQWHDIVLSPRGGGTGTNGQSLSDGIVVDTSRHMTGILEINVEERWARVQCGVVKDQLNAAIKPHGLFFAPDLSTSNRATIGGMINTDASGQGSVAYGKTRDHVLDLTTVLGDGSVLNSHPVSDAEYADACQLPDRRGQVYRTVGRIWDERRSEIEATFPPLNRCLTGYDLAHIRDEQGRLNLNNILCGSEGTLGFIAEARLNLTPIPATSALVNVFYDNFEASLRDAQALMARKPTSIETVDDIVLELAQGDIVWTQVGDYFPAQGNPIRGINLVEYTAASEAELEEKLTAMTRHLDEVKGQTGQCTGYTVARGAGEVGKIWNMRKRAVGLLGNAQGEARPVPFVEDTAVPPENLADYIMGFRRILDSKGLRYGMFGHVDAGVLHVRPILDMKDPEQAAMIRPITEELVALIRRYGGLLWGEHGKGVRSEFAPAFFGGLYPALQEVKAAFDPRNQLNPGKIATPNAGTELLKIDQVQTRGELDRTIPTGMWQQFSSGVYCNGNGACHNWDPNDFMCPSWKATRDRRQTPKGRASLMREWLHELSRDGIDSRDLTEKARRQNPVLSFPARAWRTLRRPSEGLEADMVDSFMGCLACKSCSGQCPVKVDVPTFRAQYLEIHYSRYLRPLKDYLIGSLESTVPTLSRVPWLYNAVMRNGLVKKLLKHGAGMVDSPLLSGRALSRDLQQRSIPWADVYSLGALDDATRQRAVILVQDAFTTYFDTDSVVDVLDTLRGFGFYPLVLPYQANGKPLHVHGFHPAFVRTASAMVRTLRALSAYDVPFVGVDPSMVLAFRSEYLKEPELGPVPPVALLQEFLAERLDASNVAPIEPQSGDTWYLLGHCTESTNAAPSIKAWQRVFAHLGMDLEVLSAGCCGMAGTFGHETRNLATSVKLYDLSWRERVESDRFRNRLVASGYSCRSQARRLSDRQLPHPAAALAERLRALKADSDTHRVPASAHAR